MRSQAAVSTGCLLLILVSSQWSESAILDVTPSTDLNNLAVGQTVRFDVNVSEIDVDGTFTLDLGIDFPSDVFGTAQLTSFFGNPPPAGIPFNGGTVYSIGFLPHVGSVVARPGSVYAQIISFGGVAPSLSFETTVERAGSGTITSRAGGTDASSHYFSVDGTPLSFSVGSQPPPTKIYLAFGEEVPWDYAGENLRASETFPKKISGSMSPDESLVDHQDSIASRVRQLFDDAGVNVEVVVGAPPSDIGTATVVYFTDENVQTGFYGDADPDSFGIDHSNSNPGEAVVFVETLRNSGTTGIIGENFEEHLVNNVVKTVAHEIGHTVGLLHNDPTGANAIEVMDEHLPQGMAILGFHGAPTQITDENGFYASFDQNSEYHLRRFVAGESPEGLSAAGLVAGTWDLTVVEMVTVALRNLTSSEIVGVLNRFRVLIPGSALGATSLRTLLEIGQIAFSDLEGLQFQVPKGTEFTIVADLNSTNDFFLTFDLDSITNNLFSPAVGGDTTGFFFRDSGAEFVHVGTVSVDVTPVPEPSSFWTFLLLPLVLYFVRTRSVRKRNAPTYRSSLAETDISELFALAHSHSPSGAATVTIPSVPSTTV